MVVVRITGYAIVGMAFAALAFAYWRQVGVSEDQAAVLKRRSPVVDYIAASNATQSCRDFYRYRKDAHQAKFLIEVSNRTGPDPQLLAAIQRDETDLTNIDALCPYPQAPTFDASGNLVGPSPTGPSYPSSTSTASG